jgi:hypothetical protein
MSLIDVVCLCNLLVSVYVQEKKQISIHTYVIFISLDLIESCLGGSGSQFLSNLNGSVKCIRSSVIFMSLGNDFSPFRDCVAMKFSLFDLIFVKVRDLHKLCWLHQLQSCETHSHKQKKLF